MNEIKFKFIDNRYSYSLPVLGVNLQFLRDRKSEVHNCMRQLAKKIGEIDISSADGVAEFDKANKLVRYYFFALKVINSKADILTTGDKLETKEAKEKIAAYMYNETREKTR